MQQFYQLIQDLHLFLRQEWEEGRVSSFKEQVPTFSKNSFAKTSSKTPSQVLAKSEEVPKPQNTFSPPPQVAEKTPKVIFEEKPPASLFELLPPQVEAYSSFEMRILMAKLFPHLELVDPLVPIVLVLPKENPSHRAFLESVCKALIQNIAYAEVVCFSEKGFPPCEILIAPLSFLKKSGPFHHIYEEKKGEKIFPLADLDLYLKDTQLKRDLWTALKALPAQLFPDTPQSS